MSGKSNLKRAAVSGAAVGALMILLNAFLQPEFAAAGIGAIALTVLGGTLGGAILFVFVTWIANLLFR